MSSAALTLSHCQPQLLLTGIVADIFSSDAGAGEETSPELAALVSEDDTASSLFYLLACELTKQL
jgi:hypothetical protein